MHLFQENILLMLSNLACWIARVDDNNCFYVAIVLEHNL